MDQRWDLGPVPATEASRAAAREYRQVLRAGTISRRSEKVTVTVTRTYAFYPRHVRRTQGVTPQALWENAWTRTASTRATFSFRSGVLRAYVRDGNGPLHGAVPGVLAPGLIPLTNDWYLADPHQLLPGSVAARPSISEVLHHLLSHPAFFDQLRAAAAATDQMRIHRPAELIDLAEAGDTPLSLPFLLAHPVAAELARNGYTTAADANYYTWQTDTVRHALRAPNMSVAADRLIGTRHNRPARRHLLKILGHSPATAALLGELRPLCMQLQPSQLAAVLAAAAPHDHPRRSPLPGSIPRDTLQQAGEELGPRRITQMLTDAVSHPAPERLSYTLDTFSMLAAHRDLFDTHQLSQATTLDRLHDAGVAAVNRQRRAASPLADIPPHLPDPVRNLDGHELCDEDGTILRIQMPATAGDLLDWGQALHHCIGSYQTKAVTGLSWLFALTDPSTGRPRYTAEVSPDDRTVRQLYGRYNSPAPTSLTAKLEACVQTQVPEGLCAPDQRERDAILAQHNIDPVTRGDHHLAQVPF